MCNDDYSYSKITINDDSNITKHFTTHLKDRTRFTLQYVNIL